MKQIILLLLLSFSLNGSDFFELMGKKTVHWVHVSKDKDLQLLKRFEDLYEKQKPYIYAARQDTFNIPPTIHFIWLGPHPFPPESVENVRSWIARHPGWKCKFWTDRKRPAPCSLMEVCDVNTFPFLFSKEHFDSSQNWGEKSDVLRFEILYQEGGLYVDHDAKCLESFDTLHKSFDLYCCLEPPHPPFVGANITVGNSIIGSRAFHPVVGRVLQLINRDWDDVGIKYQGRDGYSRTQLVMERTYMTLTYAITERLEEDQNNDIVLPAAYLLAKSGMTPLFAQHLYATTWTDEQDNEELEEKTKEILLQLQKRNGTVRWVGRGALSCNLLAFAGMFFYLMRKRRRRDE